VQFLTTSRSFLEYPFTSLLAPRFMPTVELKHIR
jgi:hypothetical protein